MFLIVKGFGSDEEGFDDWVVVLRWFDGRKRLWEREKGQWWFDRGFGFGGWSQGLGRTDDGWSLEGLRKAT